MLWRANGYQAIIWTDIDQIMLSLWVNSATISWLYHFLSFILVAFSVVSLCNSFGNAAATARTTDNELHGYLTTWEGTRIIAQVTSWHRYHYSDVIMSAMAYHITSLTIVYSTVYSGADQRKHQSSVSLAFVRGIHRWPVNSRTDGQWRRKCFHLMTSLLRHASLDFVIFFTNGLATCNVIKIPFSEIIWQTIHFFMPSRFLKMEMNQKPR